MYLSILCSSTFVSSRVQSILHPYGNSHMALSSTSSCVVSFNCSAACL